LKKGDRVKWTHKGQEYHGTVEKVKKDKLVVIHDGGEYSTTASVRFFTPDSTPIPKDTPTEMDRWSIKGYQEIPGHGDSPTFSAKLCLDGKPVMTACNDGHGGPNEYQLIFLGEGMIAKMRAVRDKFHQDILDWWIALAPADEKPMEPEDLWIDWWVHSRPYAVTGKQFIVQFCEELAQFRT
jgi:hypothetical protein